MMFGKPSSASDKHGGTLSSNIHVHTSSISRQLQYDVYQITKDTDVRTVALRCHIQNTNRKNTTQHMELFISEMPILYIVFGGVEQ